MEEKAAIITGIIMGLTIGPVLGHVIADSMNSIKEKVISYLIGISICFIFGAIAGVSCLVPY